MHDKYKTKEQLIDDVEKLRKQVEELKKSLANYKKNEEDLCTSEMLYKALLQTSPDIIAASDLEGNIISISEKAAKYFGYKNADEIIGINSDDLITPDCHKDLRINRDRALKTGYSGFDEYVAVRKDGTRFYVQAWGMPIKDHNGKLIGIMSISRDVTEQKLAEQKLKQEVKSLRKQIQQSQKYPEIIGSSTKMQKIIEMINQIARTDSTVLILGETGSGKDLVARAIHYSSKRKDRPFLSINCAALPEQLIESELFGYVKGAFTGATKDKKGLFEDGNKGTIFLNEIGDIPLRLQGKLLDAIENQRIRRLGQSASIEIDVRIIAATNKDLREAVKNGSFREDLYFRLNVFPINIPSLRERKEDIPLLIKHFLDKLALSMNKEVQQISAEAMEMLCNYKYPGNVRELYNIIHRSVILAEESIILPQHLPEELKVAISIPMPGSLADMERKTIETAIRQCEGNLTHAARKLGINRTTLWRKMKKLGL